MTLDPSASPPWSFEMTPVSWVVDSPPFDGLMRLVGTVRADARTPPVFDGVRLVYCTALDIVLTALPWLKGIAPRDPIALALTNSQSKWGFNLELNDDLMSAGDPSFWENVDLAADIGFWLGNDRADDSTTLVNGFGFDFELVIDLGYVLKVELGWEVTQSGKAFTKESDKTEQEFKILAGAGLGSEAKLLGIKLEYWAILFVELKAKTTAIDGAESKTEYVVEGGLQLHGEAKVLAWLSAEFEATLAVQLLPASARTVRGELEVAVHVHICWVVDISWSYSGEFEKEL
jgi:hypothetical protein